MEERKGKRKRMIKDKDLAFPMKEGKTYYMVDYYIDKPLVVELECQKTDPEEYDWEYSLYEKKKIYGGNYPLGRMTHPEDVASVYFSSEERKEILNNYFFKDFSEACKRAFRLAFEEAG